MKVRLGLLCLVLFFSIVAQAQDEGDIVKRERIDLDKGIFVGAGPSFTLGKNIGDYSTGYNMEVGFLKRVNRILSIGPSISYLQFKYDPEKTGLNNIFTTDEFYDDQVGLYYFTGMVVDFKGGDLSLLSAALNLKFNIIPVMDNSKISVYGFAKPFVTAAKRKEVAGDATVFNVYDENDDTFYTEDEILYGYENYSVVVPWEAGDPTWASYGVVISDELKEDTRITGGIFIGPGIEFMPAKKVSIYGQVAFGYTFPVSFVSTEKYKGGSFDNITEEYPMVEQGFPSVNVQFGLSFNF